VPGDISDLQAADLVFYSGLHLEGKMTEVLERLAEQKPVVAVTGALDEAAILEADGADDPHVWFDVQLWAQTVNVVYDHLKEHDPAHAEEYEANAEAYLQELVELHAFAKDQLATIPEEQRVLVTAHDAFRYFGQAYDIEVRGIQGISTESQASVGEINDLVNFLVERRIKAVFVESSVSERNVEALVEGCRDKGHEIKIGGELFSDAMGEAGTPEGTYAGMVRHNVETIVEALK
jgi:manganese/zinc/iron transport system substrate-binding protein